MFPIWNRLWKIFFRGKVTAFVTAFVLRFINKRSHWNDYLTSGELKEVERMWIRYVQIKHFAETFQAISNETKDNLQKQLGLYVDHQGLIRCKGRLDNFQLTKGARRPTLLPDKERYTHLMIEKKYINRISILAYHKHSARWGTTSGFHMDVLLYVK